MKRSKTILRRPGIWIACAALPLALVGCGGNRAAQTTTPTDDQRVAGERQEEPSAEVRQAMQQAGLPERFVFGGRTWVGHQMHRVDRDDVAMTGTPSVSTPPGPGGAPQVKPQEGKDPFDYTPVADLQVQGHQIYRKAGLDEAVTDNIYLMASAPNTLGTTDGTGAPSTTGEPGATSGDAGEAQVTFIEYDAAGDAATMDLSQALQATGLPMTIQQGGRTFTAREVQVYDPDIFDDFGKAQMVQGHSAYVDDDDKDEMVLMGTGSAGMGTGTGTTGETGTTAPPATTEGATGETGTAAMMEGPIFIRYEEGAGDTTGAATNAPRNP